MATQTKGASGYKNKTATWTVKSGLAQMLKGGVIMDVVTADQAKIAEDSGAVAVMALERVPSDIRKMGGVSRMSDPTKIIEIKKAVTIPVMAKCRIGHFAEAQVLEALEVDYIDESEVLTPADEIGEGAAMIRTKGEAGTGNVVEAVRHARTVIGDIRQIQSMTDDMLMSKSKELGAPYELVKKVRDTGKLPVVNFAAGGIATPSDAALMMQLGVEGVFVGSGIFKSSEPSKMAEAIVKATAHYNDPDIIANVSTGLGDAMAGLDIATMPEDQQLSTRGW